MMLWLWQLIAIAGLAMLVTLTVVITAFAVTFKRKQKRGIGKRTASLADIRTELGDFRLRHNKEVESVATKMDPNKLPHAKHRRCASDGPWNLETYAAAHCSSVSSRRARPMRHHSFDAADLSYDDGHGNGGSVDNSMIGWGGTAFPQRQLSSVLSLSGDDSFWGSLGGSNHQAPAIRAAYDDPHAASSEDDSSPPGNEVRLGQGALTDNSAASAAAASQAAKPKPDDGRLQGDYDKTPTLTSLQNGDPQPDQHTPTPDDSPADDRGKSPPREATAVSPEQQPPRAAEQPMGQFFKRIFLWGSPSTGGRHRRKRSSPLPVTMDTVTVHSMNAAQPPNATGPSAVADAVAQVAPSALTETRQREDYWGLGSGSLNHYLDTEGGISSSREFSIRMPPASVPEDSTTERPSGP